MRLAAGRPSPRRPTTGAASHRERARRMTPRRGSRANLTVGALWNSDGTRRLPRGLLPDPETEAPPRFLPDYDNALLAHDDRTRILAYEHRRLAGRPTVLVDGFAIGFWKVTREGGRAILNIEALTRVSKKDVVAVSNEGARLLDFVAPDSQTRDVRFAKSR